MPRSVLLALGLAGLAGALVLLLLAGEGRPAGGDRPAEEATGHGAGTDRGAAVGTEDGPAPGEPDAGGSVDLDRTAPAAPSLLLRVQWPDGGPVPGARVWLEPYGGLRRVRWQETTGEDGRLELADLPSGTYRCRVRHPAAAWPPLQATFEVAPAGLTTPPALVLRRGREIAGSVGVREEDGRVVPGRRVGVKAFDGGGLRGETRTDGEGRFRFTGLEGGIHWLVVSERGLRAPAPVRVPAGSRDVDLVAVRGSSRIGGTVGDGEGGVPRAAARPGPPVPGATTRGEAIRRPTVFVLEPVGPARALRARLEVERSGEYRSRPLPPGRYLLECYAPGYRLGRRTVAVPPEGEVRCDFVLARGPEIRGRVRDGKGRPLAGTAVVPILEPFHSRRRQAFLGAREDVPTWRLGRVTHTDGDGTFALRADPDLSRLLLRHEDHADRTVAIDPERPPDAVEVRLQPGATVRGRVLTPAGPLMDRVLLLVPEGTSFAPLHSMTRTDLDGRFRFDHVPPGPWWLVQGSALGPVVSPAGPPVPDAAFAVGSGDVDLGVVRRLR